MKYIYLLVFLFTLIGCSTDESYTSQDLTIKTDSLSLDTVLAGEITPTHRLVVYNHSGKSLYIDKIWLSKGASSPFKVNVDGTSLAQGQEEDFEILPHDSLQIFYFLNTPDFKQDLPKKVSDELNFQVKQGKVTQVTITAYSQSVHRVKYLNITHDTILDAQRPYQIQDSIVVQKGATLTLLPGTQLLFHHNAQLIVKGKLMAKGSAERNIILRGDRLGNMLNHVPYDRLSNQWGGIIFTASSFNNVIDYTDIHGGIWGIRCDSSNIEQPKLSLLNSVIHNVTETGLWVKNGKTTIINSQLTNAGNYCLQLIGGNHTIIHATIAQFFPFIMGENGRAALYFSNENKIPIHLKIYNSIITGKNKDDLIGQQTKDEEGVDFDYTFKACFINTPADDNDENFEDCIFTKPDQNQADNFTPSFNYDMLTFSFQLNDKSPAIGKADIEISRQYAPFDRLHRSRIDNTLPDIGCYQHIAKPDADNNP